MEAFAFFPPADVPLIGFTLVAFIRHFNRWAYSRDIDTSIDVRSRLPQARIRVTVFFGSLLFLCWLCNIAIWSVFAILLTVGLVLGILLGGTLDGGAGGFLATIFFLIREWAFGFPQLILHPEVEPQVVESKQVQTGPLVGHTGFTSSPMRPSGQVSINGHDHAAVMADGAYLEKGVKIQVIGYRNGCLCVVHDRDGSSVIEPKKANG